MTREEQIKVLKDWKPELELMAKYNSNSIDYQRYTALEMAINALEQEPRKGHWIVEIWNNREHHTCSECNHVVDYEPCYHYCPFCGAKMESEEKE